MTKQSAERRLKAAIAALSAKQRARLRRHGQERRPITFDGYFVRTLMPDGTVEHLGCLATIAYFEAIPPDPDALEMPECAGVVGAFYAMHHAAGGKLFEALDTLGKDRVLEIMAGAP